MIKRPNDLTNDNSTGQPFSSALSEDAVRLPPHGAMVTRTIADSQLSVTFSCLPLEDPTGRLLKLSSSDPLLVSPLNDVGKPIATYRLNCAKLAKSQRSELGALLEKWTITSNPNAAKGAMLELAKAIFDATSTTKSVWARTLPNGERADTPGPVGSLSLYIPPIKAYLEDPSRLGRMYKSRHSDGPDARTVIVELDPPRNRVRFIVKGGRDSDGDYNPEPLIFSLPGPAEGSISTVAATRHLSLMLWRALERLWQDGESAFCYHLRELQELRSRETSVAMRNLSSAACFVVSVTPTRTLLALYGKLFNLQSKEHPAPAMCKWQLPGNMEDPGHPLHGLLVDLGQALKQPNTDQRLEDAIGRLVAASRTTDRAKMIPCAPSLDYLVDRATLEHLQSIPGMALRALVPGATLAHKPGEDIAHHEQQGDSHLVKAIAEIAQGISRVQFHLIDSEFSGNLAEAFRTLTFAVSPDGSIHMNTKSSLGEALDCFLSPKSRFPKSTEGAPDVVELACKLFALQRIPNLQVNPRKMLIDGLRRAVEMDSEHSFLVYKRPSTIDGQ